MTKREHAERRLIETIWRAKMNQPHADLVLSDTEWAFYQALLNTNPTLEREISALREVRDTAIEFQRLTQERINSSFMEAAYNPADWRRAERDLCSAIANAAVLPVEVLS